MKLDTIPSTVVFALLCFALLVILQLAKQRGLSLLLGAGKGIVFVAASPSGERLAHVPCDFSLRWGDPNKLQLRTWLLLDQVLDEFYVKSCFEKRGRCIISKQLRQINLNHKMMLLLEVWSSLPYVVPLDLALWVAFSVYTRRVSIINICKREGLINYSWFPTHRKLLIQLFKGIFLTAVPKITIQNELFVK